MIEEYGFDGHLHHAPEGSVEAHGAGRLLNLSGNGFRVAYEENPRSELTPAGTPSTGPNRISTLVHDFPVTGAQLTPNPTLLDRSDETRNLPSAIAGLQNSFAPAGSLAERVYVDDMPFLLGLSGYTGTFTAGNGVITDPDAVVIPTGASRWQFVRNQSITPQTATVTALYANEGFYLQGSGFAISNFTINAAGDYGSTWAGLYLASIADPSVVPTVIATTIPPIRRADLKITWIGSSAVASDFSLSDTAGLQVSYDLGSNGTFFPETMEIADALPNLTGSITKRQLNANDWASVISAGTFSAVARWKQTKVIGATAYTYSMWCEMPSCQITGITPDPVSANRRRGAAYDFRAAYDATAGYDVRWTVIGAITSVKTYP